LTFALFSPGTGLMWCLQPQMEGSLFKVPWYSRVSVNACFCCSQVMTLTILRQHRSVRRDLCFHISALRWIKEPPLTLVGAAIQTWYIKRALDKQGAFYGDGLISWNAEYHLVGQGLFNNIPYKSPDFYNNKRHLDV
jgi:hypothetical protein